jgi:shikimate dehydrogenase
MPTEDHTLSAIRLDGATQVLGIIGDPVAQVKAPAPLTRLLQAIGLNAVLVPLHARAPNLPALLDALAVVDNVRGLIVTVPHKQAVAGLPVVLSRRAAQCGAVNLLRKQGGSWYGELLDGLGFVRGLVKAGIDPRGLDARLIGAGGAASAIAFALFEAGVRSVGISDIDEGKRDVLIQRLRDEGLAAAPWDGRDTRGAGLLVNATPVGMRAGDPLPLPATSLHADLAVADVLMQPAVTPLLEAARAIGCRIQPGRHMMDEQLAMMVTFFTPAITGEWRQEGHA